MFDALSRAVPADAVIAVDVGNNTYSFGRYFECKRQPCSCRATSARSASASPPRWARGRPRPTGPIVAVTGDGGFGQYLAELTTAVKYEHADHPRAAQQLPARQDHPRSSAPAEWDVWQTSLHNPDFAEYARLCGAHGIRVTDASQLDDALPRRSRTTAPLVEVMTDADLV